MEYALLSSHSLKSLSEYIRDHLKEGWQLSGSLFAHGGRFYRELVRPEKK